MSTPVLHILAGPNGSGKTTFVHEILQPITRLPFINADEIAADRWPGRRTSFITETVFSHPSKRDLVEWAFTTGYLVELHVMLVPEDLSVARVAYRVSRGGHTVPEAKIRERYRRLWLLVADAQKIADRCTFYDNSRSATPFAPVARFERGHPAGPAYWPAWASADLKSL